VRPDDADRPRGVRMSLDNQNQHGKSDVCFVEAELARKNKSSGHWVQELDRQRKEVDYARDLDVDRKRLVDTLLDRRNGIPEANPGDKGYATAEHAPDFVIPAPQYHVGLSKMDRAWSQSATNALLDKLGRPLSEHIRLYVTTSLRRISLFAHFRAQLREVHEQVYKSEGHDSQSKLVFKGTVLDLEKTIADYAIRPNCTLHLVDPVPFCQSWESFHVVRSRAQATEEMDEVRRLDDWQPPGQAQPPPSTPAAAAKPGTATKGKKK